MLSRLLATVLLIATIGTVIAGLAPIGWGHIVMALLGWALVVHGADLAPVIGLEATSTSARYVEPVVRLLGWLFLVVAVSLLALRVLRLWS